MRKLGIATGQGVFIDQIYDLEQNYQFILKYTMEGVDDPERGKIHNHLVVKAFELSDRIHEYLMVKYGQSFFYRMKRTYNCILFEHPDDFLKVFDVLQDLTQIDFSLEDDQTKIQKATESWKKIINLFYSIVFIDNLSGEQMEFISIILDSHSISQEFKSLLITALTFSTMRYFDEDKLALHLDLFEANSENILVRQRCLTGFLLSLYQYDYRIKFYPSVKTRLGLMCEDPGFSRSVERILLQLTASKETEKIRQKIQEEIIPEMIRISPHIRNKLNLESLMEEGDSDDQNPEWSEIFNESPGLLEKMEELAEMQIEGADVFLSSFSMLKNIPFFNEFTNWFIPYFTEHPEIGSFDSEKPERPETKITGLLLNSPILCNSDKYSFSFLLRNLSGEARELMTGVLKKEMEQMDDIRSDQELLKPDAKGEIISNQYIQDLYRFYRLHPSRNDFEDIFSWKFDFHNKEGFQPVLEKNPELISKMAEFYFEKKYFREALELYEKSGDLQVEKLQKEAYCHQKLGNYEKALSMYRKAELFDINKVWNLKKIALCYRNLRQPEEALKVYQTIDSLEPDNMNVIYSMGYCYTETRQYQLALNCFFKIEYLSPGNKKVWKPVAWFSFLTGKKEQAEKYFRKLIEEQPDRFDLINMGHVQWALGRRVPALEYYRNSIQKGGFTVEDFMKSFEEDLQVLISQGIDPEEIPIMLDQLRYTID